MRRRDRLFVVLVPVDVVAVVEVVEVDAPGWVAVSFKGTRATAAPTTIIATIVTPAKSEMLRSMNVTQEP